jgi:hypothetical protein
LNDRSYPHCVQRALAELSPEAQAAALAQLPFAQGIDDQLTVVADAWLRCAAGSDAAGASRWIASKRRREFLDNRSAGRAVEFVDDSLPFGLGEPNLVEQDPMAALLAAEAAQVYQAELRAAGVAVDAAPATVGTVQGLATVDAARLAHRSTRSVQVHMRDVCRAELDGQGSLPGIPAAGEVYRARAIGGVA